MPQLLSESELPQPKKTGENTFELSLYTDAKPVQDDFIRATNRLSVAFPKMTKEFFLMLTEFVINENFSARRLEDAVDHVIANFQYKELNISDVIKFDRRVKLYTHPEVSKLSTPYYDAFKDFDHRKIDGITFWVKKTDILINQKF